MLIQDDFIQIFPAMKLLLRRLRVFSSENTGRGGSGVDVSTFESLLEEFPFYFAIYRISNEVALKAPEEKNKIITYRGVGPTRSTAPLYLLLWKYIYIYSRYPGTPVVNYS